MRELKDDEIIREWDKANFICASAKSAGSVPSHSWVIGHSVGYLKWKKGLKAAYRAEVSEWSAPGGKSAVFRKKDDPVEHPSHYTYGKYEVIDVLSEFFANDPLCWQVGKYIMRYQHKGKPLEDLKKARFYLNRRIEEYESPKAEECPNQSCAHHDSEEDNNCGVSFGPVCNPLDTPCSRCGQMSTWIDHKGVYRCLACDERISG